MTVRLAINYKSLHTEVSNWQVANTWRLFLHAFGLFEYSFLKLFIRKQDLYNIVFLSPFNLSDPHWITPVEVNRALEAWSDRGPKCPFECRCPGTGKRLRGTEELWQEINCITCCQENWRDEPLGAHIGSSESCSCSSQFTRWEVFQQNWGQRQSLLLTEQVWSLF